MTYKNERYKEGNTVKLMFNPYVAADFEYSSDTILSTYRKVSFESTNITATSGDIMVCNAFGGIVTANSLASGDYDPSDYCEDYDTSVADRIVGILLSLDTFDGGVIDNIYSTIKKYYVFANNSDNYISDGYISNYYTERKIARATYGKQYGLKVDNYIDVELGYIDFDKICQLFASESVAVVSCDDSFPTSVTFQDDCGDLVYGGGSCNPIARMGVVMDDTIEVGLNRDTFKVKIKLLG